jgi:hypothetical protein
VDETCRRNQGNAQELVVAKVGSCGRAEVRGKSLRANAVWRRGNPLRATRPARPLPLTQTFPLCALFIIRVELICRWISCASSSRTILGGSDRPLPVPGYPQGCPRCGDRHRFDSSALGKSLLRLQPLDCTPDSLRVFLTDSRACARSRSLRPNAPANGGCPFQKDSREGNNGFTRGKRTGCPHGLEPITE